MASMLALGAVGCGGTKTGNDTTGGAATNDNAAASTTLLKVAFNQSENHPQYKTLVSFGEKLEAETNGAYKVEVYPNALLGDQRATVELVQSGSIQMSLVANALVENYNKDFGVIGLPFVYDNKDHQQEVFTSGMLKDLFESTKSNNFQTVAAFTAGARSIYTDKAINTPADLKGYKIRVMESDTMVSMLNLMGGVGTPMGQSEVYTAIQQGVLEGGENNEITYADLKHYEVAPFYSYTQHLMIPDLLIMNTATLEGMSEENRAIFDRLMAEAVKDEFALWDEQVLEAKKTAEANGATFVEVDMTPFQENIVPLQEKVTATSETAKALYDQIRSIAK